MPDTVAAAQGVGAATAGVRELSFADAIREALAEEMRRDPRVVLLGEDLGRGHQGALVSALDGGQQGAERDDGLPGADVALEEPVHRPGGSEIGADLGDGPLLVAGQPEGQLSMERRHQGPVRPMPEPDPAFLEGPLPRHETELHAEEFVELEPMGGPEVVRLRLRLMDAVVSAGAARHPEAVEDLPGDRVVELHDPAQRLGHELLELPGRDVGLPRLGIDRHDDAGLLADTAEDVDRRVRHLVLPPVVLELSEESRFGADGKLLRPPRLVEERDVEIRRSVVDDGLDQRPALPGPPGAHLANLGVDRRLLPHPEVGDVGLLRAVQIPAGIVLDQLEHVLDPQHAEPLLDPRRDTRDPLDLDLFQLAQGLAHCRASVSALLS